jgi:hypothetical protein
LRLKFAAVICCCLRQQLTMSLRCLVYVWTLSKHSIMLSRCATPLALCRVSIDEGAHVLWVLRWAYVHTSAGLAGVCSVLLLLNVLQARCCCMCCFAASGAVAVCAAPYLEGPLISTAAASWQGGLGLLQLGAARLAIAPSTRALVRSRASLVVALVAAQLQQLLDWDGSNHSSNDLGMASLMSPACYTQSCSTMLCQSACYLLVVVFQMPETPECTPAVATALPPQWPSNSIDAIVLCMLATAASSSGKARCCSS